MTRPTLPGLVAEWTKQAFGLSNPKDEWDEGYADAKKECAAELSQAVALTDEEKQALIYMDNGRASADADSSTFTAYAADYDTLRALLTRLTAASDGGVKGETK